MFSPFVLLLSKINDSEVEKVCAVLDRPMLRADGLFVIFGIFDKKATVKEAVLRRFNLFDQKHCGAAMSLRHTCAAQPH